MKTAVAASSRTAEGARQSLNRGFQIALRSSAVLGLAVVGFGLLDISIWYIVLNAFYDNNIFNVSQTLAIKAGLMSDSATFDPNILTQEIFKHSKLVEITTTMVTFVAGASIHALFSRVAGSMFAQGTAFAATFDFGVSSDDKKNPVSITKGVSEQVSGIVGMGADIYESYASVIIAAAVMGAAFILPAAADENAVVAPMIVATLAVLLSIGGLFLATAKDDADDKTLMATLNRGIWAVLLR
jgi:K(+)-stimulated pyrophosphate-energized sodium pump